MNMCDYLTVTANGLFIFQWDSRGCLHLSAVCQIKYNVIAAGC